MKNFNPLAPRGARPRSEAQQIDRRTISIHSPLAGRDKMTILNRQMHFVFQSTRPSRGETTTDKDVGTLPFISIHSPLAGRDDREIIDLHTKTIISIHSPLAGRDAVPSITFTGETGISIHSPLAGRDWPEMTSLFVILISIHSPLAGRDGGAVWIPDRPWHFNPLAPRGARRFRPLLIVGNSSFQSTRPSRGETITTAGSKAGAVNHFNPLAPRGARPKASLLTFPAKAFQSTRPSRGETANSDKVLPAEIIHIAQLISLQIRK